MEGVRANKVIFFPRPIVWVRRLCLFLGLSIFFLTPVFLEALIQPSFSTEPSKDYCLKNHPQHQHNCRKILQCCCHYAREGKLAELRVALENLKEILGPNAANEALFLTSSQDKGNLMHCAVEGNKASIAEYLLSNRINPNRKNSAGLTATYRTSQYGNTGFIERVYAQGKESINFLEKDPMGRTMAHQAAIHAHFVFLKFLLGLDKEGIAVGLDKLDCYGVPPLHYLIENYQESRNLKNLFNKNLDSIDLFTRYIQGDSVADLHNKDELAKSRLPELHEAAYCGDFKRIKDLMKNENDVDIHESLGGASPLCYAIHGGHIEAVDLLLYYYKADIHYRNHDGFGPLAWAINSENLEQSKIMFNYVLSKLKESVFSFSYYRNTLWSYFW